MLDVIAFLGIITGIILLIIGIKRPNLKLIKLLGILIVIISLVIGAPDFIEGFKDGVKDGWNASFKA